MKFGVILKLRLFLLVVILTLVTALTFAFSKPLRQGINDGFALSVNVVIPSLFVFTSIALFISSSGVGREIGRITEPISKKLFYLNSNEFSVMFMSFLSGYPVGAKLIAEMYGREEISIKKAKVMLLYCINAGPAFIITAVGVGVLGSKSDGVRLLISHILTSCLMAIVLGFYIRRNDTYSKTTPTQKPKVYLSDCFVNSVTDAAVSMFSISAFVVLFSGIGSMVDALSVDDAIKFSVRGLLEVTVGVQNCTRNFLGRVAFLLGFGGFSVIFQVMSSARKIKPSFLSLLFSRLIHGTLSAVIVEIINRIFPRVVDTVSLGKDVTGGAFHTSLTASVALIFLSVVLICYVSRVKIKIQ